MDTNEKVMDGMLSALGEAQARAVTAAVLALTLGWTCETRRRQAAGDLLADRADDTLE